MYRQRTRDLYFATMQPLNKLNYWRWRLRSTPANGTSEVHLHLGCGPKYLPGFINIDGNLFRRTNLWLDLRNGLPFPDGAVASAYSCHVFEHFYPDELARLLRECHRVLRPGGGLRAVVPDMGGAVRAYLEGRGDYFTDFPRPLRSLGGKLSNLLFCDGNHRQGFDLSYMEEVLSAAGFAEIWEGSAAESRIYPPETFPRLQQEEAGLAAVSLFVECRKREPRPV
jgi:predicted SAM-dependent methyltransferase